MSKRHIRIDLGGGAWGKVSPSVSPETVAALERMMEAARLQFGEKRIARLTQEER